MVTNFIMTFIPLFVAFDAIGVLPIYLSLTQDMDTDVRARVLRHSIITASAITVLFLLIGKGIFIILGITISDFQIGGGLILLVIAIHWGLMYFVTNVWQMLGLRIFLGLFSGFGTMSVALVTHGGPVGVLLKELGLPDRDLDAYRRRFDRNNPLPPAGAWKASRLPASSAWSLSLVFTPEKFTTAAI